MKHSVKYYKKFDKKFPIGNQKFQKILLFYLFECPTPNKSHRGKSFSDLGWNGTSQFSYLKKELLNSATESLKNNYHPCKKEELEKAFISVESVSPVDEYCVFLKSDEKSVMQSLFSAIRNSFAHGSFAVQRYKDNSGKNIQIFFFSNFDGYLKAELVLQEETLLRWIDIVNSGHPSKTK